MSNSHAPSWPVATVVSVLAGVGAGYVVGVITTKLWQARKRQSAPLNGREDQHSAQSHADLVAALSALTSQVENLQTALGELSSRAVRSRLRPPGAPESVASGYARTESMSEFVSAQGDNPESDDEFFDMERDEEAESGSQLDIQHLDELGKSSEEREDTCHQLVNELRTQLAGAPDDVHLLWRLARVLVHLSMHCSQQGKGDEEKRLLLEATEHAQKALEIDDTVWQSHQWFAIALGSQLKHEGTRKRIIDGFTYKKHIDTAISLNPTHPSLFYLRGRWEYEVAGITLAEKTLASCLYAKPPTATYNEALNDFMMVESLNGGVWKANLMMIGKCHIKLHDIASALDWLHKSLQLDIVTSEDKNAHKEVEELIATYR